MNFEWKMEKGEELTFDDKVHNLACFEVVLNILRMKTMAGDKDVSQEMQTLCFFALESMFRDSNLDDSDFFETIMHLKEKKVNKVKAEMLGIPEEMARAHEVGEA